MCKITKNIYDHFPPAPGLSAVQGQQRKRKLKVKESRPLNEPFSCNGE